MEDRLSQRYTDRARRVMAYAQLAARTFFSDAIAPEHMLLGLIVSGDTDIPDSPVGCVVGYRVLLALGVDTKKVRRELESAQGGRPRTAGLGAGSVEQLALQDDTEQVLSFARDEARSLGHDYVGTEHLLLGLVRAASGPAAQLLRYKGVTLDTVRVAVRTELERIASSRLAREELHSVLSRLSLEQAEAHRAGDTARAGELQRQAEELFRRTLGGAKP